MTRPAARRIHLGALAVAASAAIVAGWAWNEATRPIRWAGHLTQGWNRPDQMQGSTAKVENP